MLRSRLKKILQYSVSVLIVLFASTEVLSAIDVEIEAAPLTGRAPLEVTFKAKVGGGEAKSFYWDFADEIDKEPCEDQECTHEFKKYGTYTVTLTVTDGSGNKVVKTVQIKDIQKRPGCPY